MRISLLSMRSSSCDMREDRRANWYSNGCCQFLKGAKGNWFIYFIEAKFDFFPRNQEDKKDWTSHTKDKLAPFSNSWTEHIAKAILFRRWPYKNTSPSYKLSCFVEQISMHRCNTVLRVQLQLKHWNELINSILVSELIEDSNRSDQIGISDHLEWIVFF